MKTNKLNKINPKHEFPKVEKMLYKLAWDFSRSYGMPFEEARSEAYAGFMKACNNFQEGKGSRFSSWCYMVTWGYLKSFIMHRASDRLVFMEPNEKTAGSYSGSGAVNVSTLQLVESLNANASLSQTLRSLLLDCPDQFLDVSESLSLEASELLALFMETPPSNARRRSEQVRLAKERHAEIHGEDATRSAFAELSERLLSVWA